MDFYTIYKGLCEEKGKSATGVAVSLGISRSVVNNWKNGGIPNSSTLNKLAKYFNISTDYLLGNSDIRNPISKENDMEETAKVALFGGDGDVTDEMWQEVKDYVDFVKQRKNKKDDT